MSMKSLVRRRPLRHRRQGAAVVEMALVLPLVMLMTIGLCVAELAVFRYHQVAALAHESARWASVHGKNYARRSNKPVATTDDILKYVIAPRAVGLDRSKLTPELKWNENFTAVSVTVNYQWAPEFAFFVPNTFTCTAVSLSSY
jgi:Flp pilus assembly protein TadG